MHPLPQVKTPRVQSRSQEQLQTCCQQQNEGRGVLDEVEDCSQYSSEIL